MMPQKVTLVTDQEVEITVKRPSPQSPLAIRVSQWSDGTINIHTPDGGLTKIWPEVVVPAVLPEVMPNDQN